MGFVATGGGGFPASELPGLEFPGESLDAVGVFFHGVEDPFAGPMPGKTDTGFADASAVKGEARTVLVAVAAGLAGTGRLRAGGGGAAAAGAGASSR